MTPNELGSTIVNHLWQSTVVVGAAWVLSLVLTKNQARMRYCMWFVASMKFLVPFSPLMAAGEWLRGLLPATSVTHLALASAIEQVAQPFPAGELLGPAPSAAHAPPSHWLVLVLLAVWACGSLVVLARFALGWLRVHAAMRSAQSIDLAAGIPVFLSSAKIEPGIFGIFRPVLLLPEGILERLSPEQVQAIIAHEMEHVRRRDNLTFVLHMIVEAIFWFHPAVWWIGARLIEERERACDEVVLQADVELQTYAESILNVCKFYVESPAACVSGITGADLKRRVAQIMSGHFGKKLGLGKKVILGTVCLVAIATPLAFGVVRMIPMHVQILHATGPLPSYEVATIKSEGGPDAGNLPGNMRRFIGTTKDLIEGAYNIPY
jgi:bla regulator protein blaR1